MSAPPLIVIFGAAVEADGRPSPALRRRIHGGLEAALRFPAAPVLCSGGARAGGRSEAEVMAETLIGQGVEAWRLFLDPASRNTRGNVAVAARQVQAGEHPGVIACTDGYHLPRVRLLLALRGVASTPWPGPDRAPAGTRIAMGLREALAIPHSVVLTLARRGGQAS